MSRPVDELADHSKARDKRASHPLGILLLRREITSTQHYAGRRYLGLFVRAVRGFGIQSVLGRLMRGPHWPSFEAATPLDMLGDEAAEIRVAFLAARRALHRARDGIASAVDAVVVHESMPANGPGLAKLKVGHAVG